MDEQNVTKCLREFQTLSDIPKFIFQLMIMPRSSLLGNYNVVALLEDEEMPLWHLVSNILDTLQYKLYHM